MVDRLAMDANDHNREIIASDFNAWAEKLGGQETNQRGRSYFSSEFYICGHRMRQHFSKEVNMKKLH